MEQIGLATILVADSLVNGAKSEGSLQLLSVPDSSAPYVQNTVSVDDHHQRWVVEVVPHVLIWP